MANLVPRSRFGRFEERKKVRSKKMGGGGRGGGEEETRSGKLRSEMKCDWLFR